MIRCIPSLLSLAILLLAPIGGNATDQILLGTARANAGTTGVTIDISITNDQPIHAFSLSLSFDPNHLTLRQITDEGTVIADLGTEFFYPTIDNNTGNAVLGVIFSYNEKDPFTELRMEPSPDTPQRVAVLSFDIAEEVPPGDYPIQLIDRLGSPPVSNIFSTGGTTTHPELQDGTVTVNNENFLRLDQQHAVPGLVAKVKAFGLFPENLQGYSIAFTYDKSILTLVDTTFAGTDAQGLIWPETIEFFQPRLEPDHSPTLARASLGAVLDYLPPWTGHEIPASPAEFNSLAVFHLEVKNDPALVGSETPLVFHNGGTGSINNIFIVDQKSFTPAMIDGSIIFISSPGFKRGYVNADKNLDLSDVVFLLSNLFLGGPFPTCMNSADINDDERYDLSDAVYLLSYLYTGGNKPPEPLAGCGPDPTQGGLTCESFQQCP